MQFVKKKNVIWHIDLQKYIKQYMDIDVQIQVELGYAAQDSYTESFESISKDDYADPETKAAVDNYLRKFVNDEFDEDEERWDLDAFLKVLVNKEVLPEGPYLVTIWW